jgi:DNA-binding SARP family transcriptional activator
MDFCILGRLEALDDGQPVALGGARQRALLALLVIRANETLATERLIDELWGERPPATAAKTVQVHVSRLRKALERSGTGVDRETLVTRERGYELRVDPERIDSHRFERLIVAGRRELVASRPERALSLLEEALSLWRGPALAEFAYERFAQAEIARLDELRVGALEELIETKLALRRHAEVVGELESLIAEQPYRERLRAQLMLALYRCDRQADALQAYQDARSRLVEELGIEPGQRLRELEAAILAQDQALAIADHPRAGVEPVAEPPASVFVGRQAELGELLAGLVDAFGGNGRVFLLVGEPGVGKSRLAEELARHARAQGAQLLIGRCWEAGGAPAFWPWVQSFRAYLRASDRDDLIEELGPGAAEIAPILPELYELIPELPQPTAPESEGARFRLFQATAEFLRRASERRPLVLILDDLHAADAPSLLLLQFLARELGSTHVLLVAAMRDVAPTPGETLTAMLAEVAREPATRRASLRGLTPADVAEYVQLAAADIASPELTSALYAETEGNPLFLTETVRLLALEGVPSQPTGGPRLAIPQTVRDVISRRLAHLSPGCTQVLMSASVLGREFATDALELVCAEPEERFLEALEEATAARVITEVPGARGRARFSHVLVRDALYERLGAARRARLHRRVGAALEELYAGDLGSHLAELAHHFYEATPSGVPNKAIDYARQAAERAVVSLAYEEAVRLYGMALDALDRIPPDGVTRCELLLARGEAQARAGDTPAAKETFLLAAELARENGRAEQLARAALGYGGRFVFNASRDDPRLRPLLEEALAALGDTDRELQTRLMARLAGGPLRDDPSRERRASLSEQAIERARRARDPALLAYALDARHMAVWSPDTIQERFTIAAEMVHLGEAAGELERLYQGHSYRIWSLLELGDGDAVAAELSIMSRLADQLRQPAQLWNLAVTRTACALLEGRFEEAEEMIEDSLELGRRAIPWNAEVTHGMQLFLLRREQGRLAEVETAVTRAVDANPTYPVWRCVQADLYAQLGRNEDARAVFEQFAATDFANLPFNEEWLLGMTLLSEVGAALCDTSRALTLYELLLPYARLHAVGQPEISLGAIARALGKLATTTAHFDQAARQFNTAIELNERMGARPWIAHTRHDYAAMLAACGRRPEGQQQLEQALATYRELRMGTWAERASQLEWSASPTPPG